MLKAHYSYKDFLPLVIIFSLVIFGSWMWNMVVEGDFMRWMELFMGIFFLVFGSLKLINLKNFHSAYRMYDLVAMKFSWYGYAYPFVELALGALYVLSLYPLATNIVTLVVMLVSAWGVLLKLLSGEKIMCACLGAVFKVPMTWVTLAEDLLMAAMALYMLVVVF